MRWVMRIKDFNILRVHGKIRFLVGGGFTKNPINKEDCLKRVLGKLADLIGALGKKEGVLFWGRGWCPNAHCGYKQQEPKY